MVAKCINPYCSRPFHHLDHGKLFVTEYPPSFPELHVRKREHFWLCEECSKTMTVAIRHEHGRPAIRIINLSPNGTRKLDFDPETAAMDHPIVATGKTQFPEFSFEAHKGY